jgi:hypothetical protein
MHVLIAVAALIAAAPADAGIRSEEAHFLISFRGQAIGKARQVLIVEAADDGPRLTLVTDEHYRFATGDRPPAESSLHRVATMRGDWTPVSIEETLSADGRVTKRSLTFADGKAVFSVEGGAPRTVPVNCAMLAEMDGRALAVRKLLSPGAGLTAAVPDLAQGGVAVLRASVLGERTVEGRPGRLLLIGVAAADGGQQWDLLVDENGRTVEQTTGEMSRRRVEAGRAVLPDRPETLSVGAVPLAGAPAAPGRLTALTLTIELPEPAPGLVPELPGQQVSEAGRRVTVTLTERRPNGLLPATELTDADRARWLTPDGEPDWRDAEVRRLADGIVRGAGGELQRGFLIGRWVHRNLAKSLGGPPEASAKQALAARGGDCSEHAAVFAALCRAAGLPARTAWGLAASGGALHFHVWNEYHAGGSWVPLDAALGRHGLPAAYVTLGYDREEAGNRLFKLYAVARARTIEFREAPRPESGAPAGAEAPGR